MDCQSIGLAKIVCYWNDANAARFRLNEIPNPDLAWEISKIIDFGIGFRFFNGKLSGTFDWYSTETSDPLLERFLPDTSGYDFVLQNVGSTETNGIELIFNAAIIDASNGFKWNLNFNIAHYNEAMTELALKDENGNPLDDIGNQWFIGQPIRVFYDYQKIGIWQAEEADLAQRVDGAFPGEIRLADVAGPRDADGSLTGPGGTISGED